MRRARSWYTTLGGPNDPIIMEITHELAEVHEYQMLDSDQLTNYFGQRPGTADNVEGVWEAYFQVLADKEKRFGPDASEVIKYRKEIHRKLWNAIRRMRSLAKVCKYEEWAYKSQAEIDELEKLADGLNERNRAGQVPPDQTTN